MRQTKDLISYKVTIQPYGTTNKHREEGDFLEKDEKPYFENIEDRFFEVRKLLQKYDLKKISEDELINSIKETVDYRSDY
jgi:hypothetical protein